MTRHLTLPNQLTIFRLLLVPVIGYSLSADFAYHAQVSAAVYATAAATDTLDGQIARRRNSVTELGKFLDPLVDKILVITVLVILVGQNIIPAWVVVVVFGARVPHHRRPRSSPPTRAWWWRRRRGASRRR